MSAVSIFLIAYKLANPASIKKESEIGDAIKEITDRWWHHLPTVWLIAGKDLTANEIYNKISGLFVIKGENTDNLFVARLAPDDNQGFLPQRAWDWINNIEKEMRQQRSS